MPRLPPMSVSHVSRAALAVPPQVAGIVKLVGITIVYRRNKPGRYQQLITTAQSGRSRIFRKISQKKMIPGLERKQYIRAARVGNTYQYTPLIRESEYKRTFMSGFVRNYFENSYKEMVSFFAKDQKISTDDLKDIIELIEKGKEK